MTMKKYVKDMYNIIHNGENVGTPMDKAHMPAEGSFINAVRFLENESAASRVNLTNGFSIERYVKNV